MEYKNILMQVKDMGITGNIVPISWFKTIRYKSKNKVGKPYLLAINILSDIVYWYRPAEVRDEATGELIGYKKKFKGDLLQRSYSQMAEMFGCSKREATNAIVRLEQLGVVKRHFRVIRSENFVANNVLFIELIPEILKKLTNYKDDLILDNSESETLPLSKVIGSPFEKGEGPTFKSETNTKNTNIDYVTYKKERKEESKKESPRHFLGEGYLNFEKESSKAKAFEETESQLQDFSLSQESVVCNKSKAGSQKNNSEMKALDLSKNDLACQKTKASRVKTIEKLKPFDEIIEAYTQNEKLRFELKEHLKVRKQKKAALTNRAIELSLQKLNSLASSDEEKLQIVQNAVMGGWTTFYPLRREETPRREHNKYTKKSEKANTPGAEPQRSGDYELSLDQTFEESVAIYVRVTNEEMKRAAEANGTEYKPLTVEGVIKEIEEKNKKLKDEVAQKNKEEGHYGF